MPWISKFSKYFHLNCLHVIFIFYVLILLKNKPKIREFSCEINVVFYVVNERFCEKANKEKNKHF